MYSSCSIYYANPTSSGCLPGAGLQSTAAAAATAASSSWMLLLLSAKLAEVVRWQRVMSARLGLRSERMNERMSERKNARTRSAAAAAARFLRSHTTALG